MTSESRQRTNCLLCFTDYDINQHNTLATYNSSRIRPRAKVATVKLANHQRKLGLRERGKASRRAHKSAPAKHPLSTEGGTAPSRTSRRRTHRPRPGRDEQRHTEGRHRPITRIAQRQLCSRAATGLRAGEEPPRAPWTSTDCHRLCPPPPSLTKPQPSISSWME